jgi:hypothetical protein
LVRDALKDDYPKLYEYLRANGKAFLVKFKIPFANIKDYNQDSIIYQFVSYFAGKYFWNYDYKTHFDGNTNKEIPATDILDVLNRETDVKHQEYIYQVLARFNAAVKVVEEAIGINPTDEEWSGYEEEYYDMYINILLNNLNKLYFRFGKTNFMEEYSQVYWKHTQEFILQLWKELPDGKSVAANEASFIKIFDDFFC